jgi:DNA-binding response OmpR family regulator
MKSLKIFVVDDDKDAAQGLAEVLEMFGHQVQQAFNGEEAVRIFKEQDFDVSLMDIMMPGMNGVESFMEIRKIKPNAKVFMMTGYSVQQLMQQAIENGALGVLNKPVDMEGLIRSLDDIKPEGMVLLADDDPNFCAGMRDVLTQQGYNVCVANTGKEALDKAMNDNVDVLVLDLRLPVVNGLEVYLELKKRGRVMPTIVVTGHAQEETEALDTFRDLCSTGVLVKPFNPSQLVKALESISADDVPAPAAAPAPPPQAPAAAPAPQAVAPAPAPAPAPAATPQPAAVRPTVQKVSYSTGGATNSTGGVSYFVDQKPSKTG